MKPSLIVLLLIGLLSCNEPDPFLPLNTGLIPTVKAYDLDNNGNGSDIRVDFEVKDNNNVIEYRIMVVPSSLKNSFNEDIAASISEESYFRLVPESFENEYSIKRLPSGLLAINGTQIQNEKEYVAAVFVLGKDNVQLSGYSGQIFLRDQGIYNGRYSNGYEKFCVLPDGSTQNLDRGASTGNYYIDLEKEFDSNKYQGEIFCSVCCATPHPGHTVSTCIKVPHGRVQFSVDGTNITNYWRGLHSICPLNPDAFPETCDYYFLSCGVEQGAGKIIDELTLEIAITIDDCEKSCGGTVVFVRQG